MERAELLKQNERFLEALKPLDEELEQIKLSAKQPDQTTPANIETARQTLISKIDAQIQSLDKEFTQQEIKPGTESEVLAQVGQRQIAQRIYDDRRRRLVKLRDEATGPSQAVLDFLKGDKKIESKFDLDAEKAKA